MKKNPSEWLRRSQALLLIAAGSMPLLLFFAGYFVPERMAVSWIMPLAFLLLAELVIMTPGKWRVLCCVLCILVYLAAAVVFAANTGIWWLLLFAAAYSILLFVCMPIGGWAWYDELPPFAAYAGLVFFLGVQIVSYLIKDVGAELQERISTGMTISFLVYVLMVLLSMNRSTLNSAAMQKHRASANVRRKNRTMILAFFLLVTLIVATPAILNAVWSFVLWILKCIRELIELLRGSDKQPVIPPATNVPTAPPQMDMGGETTAFARLMQKIFSVLSIAALVLLIPLLLLLFGSKMAKWLRKLKKLAEKMNRILASSSEDYEEEITDIRDDDDEKGLFSAARHWFGIGRERRLPPGERIRYRYGKLRTRHPEWTDSATARDNLPEQTASVYERARYSRHTMTEEEAKRFASDTKRI